MPSPITSASPSPQHILEPVSDPPPPQVITLPPVLIEAGPGARQLVERHAAPSPPNCRAEKATALERLLPIAIDTLTAFGASRAAPLAFYVSLAKLLHDGIKEGEALRKLYDCKTQGPP